MPHNKFPTLVIFCYALSQMWGLKRIVFSFLFLYRGWVPLMLMGSMCKEKIITLTGVSHPPTKIGDLLVNDENF